MGYDFFDKISDIFEEISIKGRLLIISDPYLFNLYGNQVCNQIKGKFEFDKKFIQDSSLKTSLLLAEELLINDYDYIVGIGGGKILDVCKHSAHISKKKFVSIPTSISNDGISSPISVLKLDNGKVKSLGSSTPFAIIVDTKVISQSPIQLIKAGIGDTLSNYTALHDWQIAEKAQRDRVNDFAFLMSSLSFNNLFNSALLDLTDINLLSILVQSLVLSGIAMEISGTSRPCSGSEHLFSHALDFYYNKNNLHGFQVALGSIVMAKIQGGDYQKLINYLERYNVSVNPKELNISKKEFIFCMNNAKKVRPDRYTILNEVEFSSKELSILYEELLSKLK